MNSKKYAVAVWLAGALVAAGGISYEAPMVAGELDAVLITGSKAGWTARTQDRLDPVVGHPVVRPVVRPLLCLNRNDTPLSQ